MTKQEAIKEIAEIIEKHGSEDLQGYLDLLSIEAPEPERQPPERRLTTDERRAAWRQFAAACAGTEYYDERPVGQLVPQDIANRADDLLMQYEGRVNVGNL